MQKLAAFPEIETKFSTLRSPPRNRDLNSVLDFVVGTNVLHAVADVRVALRNLHGLTCSGWLARFYGCGHTAALDRSRFRPDQRVVAFHRPRYSKCASLLGRSQWEQLLQETGFVETTSLPGFIGQFGEGQIAILGRKAYESPAPSHSVSEVPTGKSWLIFADESGIGKSLAERLRTSGAHCRTVHRGTAYRVLATDTFTIRPEAPEDWRQLLQACTGEELERIVYLWNLDTEFDYDAVFGTDALLHLAQALDAVFPGAKLRIDSVTRGAQPVGRDVEPTAVAQAPAIGLLRVILNEYPNYVCRGIDLPPADSAADLDLIWTELLRTESEREVALRGDARYLQRIDRGRALD